MKAIKIFSVFFIMCILCNTQVSAQNDLTESDKKEMQERVKLKVEEFQGYLSDIVNTSLTSTQRKASVSSALALFIGKGSAYTIINDYGEKENRGAARIQISSVNKSYVKWLAMTKYLDNQYNNVYRYGKITIEAADAVRVDNIYKTGDGRYQAVAYFCQKYAAYRDGKIVYSDITGKKVTVYISAIETPVGTVWDAKLGDIYVTSTKSGF